MITERGIQVRFQKRDHNPLLIAAGLAKTDLPVPWPGNRRLQLVSDSTKATQQNRLAPTPSAQYRKRVGRDEQLDAAGDTVFAPDQALTFQGE
jgi:hypothetical protein